MTSELHSTLTCSKEMFQGNIQKGFTGKWPQLPAAFQRARKLYKEENIIEIKEDGGRKIVVY